MTGSDEQRPAPLCAHWTEDQQIRPGVRFMCQAHETREGALWHISAEQVAWRDGSKFDFPRPPAPEPAPVGTDSARAEAEARWPYGTGNLFEGQAYRLGFEAGAEWTRAEEPVLELSEAIADALSAQLAEERAARASLEAALQVIAADEEGLACSDLPHCSAVAGGQHAEDCAVGIAERALAGASRPAEREEQ